MRKETQLYEVYLIGDGEGVYRRDYCNKYLGKTRAVSEKQAISRVRYRNGNGPTEWWLGDALDEGSVHFYYKAVCIN